MLIVKDVIKELTKSIQNSKPHDDLGTKFSDWRFGPAQYWYDLLGVPENASDFNYGFRLKERTNEDENDMAATKIIDPIPEDAYLMVSQLHWEDNVVWDGDLIRNEVRLFISRK